LYFATRAPAGRLWGDTEAALAFRDRLLRAADLGGDRRLRTALLGPPRDALIEDLAGYLADLFELVKLRGGKLARALRG
jgi:hypothetical protein